MRQIYTLHAQRASVLALGALMITTQLLYHVGAIFGITAFIIYALGFVMVVAAYLHRTYGTDEQTSFGLAIAAFPLYLIIANTIFYYFYGVTTFTSILVAILPCLGAFKKTGEYCAPVPRWFTENSRTAGIFVFFAFSQIALIATLFSGQTDELLRSPWHSIPAEFFILYAVATILLVAGVWSTKNALARYAITAVHIFTTYAVVAIIYKLGFGFDAFIHRATETWIQTFGSINPKNPYYIGQYSIVVWLSNITAIPIFYIDVFLVPTLSALTLPAIIPFSISKIFEYKKTAEGLKKTGTIVNQTLKKAMFVKYAQELKETGITKNAAMLGVLTLVFLPFLFFHLTTPYNLALLLAIITICFVITYIEADFSANSIGLQSKTARFKTLTPITLLSAMGAIATLLTHPLIGAPVCLFAAYAFIIRKKNIIEIANDKNEKIKNSQQKQTRARHWKIATAFSLVVDMAIMLPILFIIQLKLGGHALPSFTNPFTHFPEFLNLFARPYWFATHAPFHFEILYAWQYAIPAVFGATALYGLFLKRKTSGALLCFFSAIGLITGSWLLRSWFIFPDVAAYEQGDYPLRILKASLLFVLPYAIFGLYSIGMYLSQKKAGRAIVVSGIGIALMLSLYLAYPQHNTKARFPGLNVTKYDFAAVNWIHDTNTKQAGETTKPNSTTQSEYNYVVLANQLVSAAALEQYSFAHYFPTAQGEQFYYSIPTGGPLYKLYGDMLYHGQKRESMIAAMDLVGVDKAYFVLNAYWANSTAIAEGAQKTADSVQRINGPDGSPAIWIFTYAR